jgi:hypothetical protein
MQITVLTRRTFAVGTKISRPLVDVPPTPTEFWASSSLLKYASTERT